VVTEDRPAAPARGSRRETEVEALIVEQRLAAKPATIFAYLTDPRKFTEWMGIGAEIDPRPGGAYRINVDNEHFAAGQYLVIDAPRRIVMTWGWEGSDEVGPGSTTVEITLEPDGQGTLLRLRHTGLETEQQRIDHRNGWSSYTGRLKEAVAQA
jgi:uncharacterized protein YndB with AHSA1/START domain